jgi:hypothetical protein
MDRLTARSNTGQAYLIDIKEDEQEVDSPYPNTLRCILEAFNRLSLIAGGRNDLRDLVIARRIISAVLIGMGVWAFWMTV